MTTKPTAARGKTTTKGKFKKMTKQISDVLKMSKKNQGLFGLPKSKGTGMNPAGMGGRSPRKTVEDMDLEKMRQRVDKIANVMGAGLLGTAGKKLKKEFDDGGIVDMTTEVDVE